MTTLLFLMAMALAGVVCLVQLPKRHGYLTYPLLVSVFYLAWLAPQIYAVAADPLAPSEGLWSLSVMVIASLTAALVGWGLGQRHAQSRLARLGPEAMPSNPPDAALVWPAVGLTVVAAGTRILLEHMRLDPSLTTQWSGPIVIVFTLAAIRIIPLYLSLAVVLRRRTPLTICVAVANLLLSGSFAFVDIGRSETIDLILVCLLALWFARRIRVRLPILAVAGLAVALFVFTVGEFRAAANRHFDDTGQRVSIFNPDIWGKVDFQEAQVHATGAPDVRNAVYLMSHLQVAGGYTLGTRFWDDFVFRWVPAQIVGKDLKAGLMFNHDPDAVYEDILNQFDYERIQGTTSTGFGIAYEEFWYLGPLLFGLYAWFAGRWWTLGSKGDLWAQLMYASTLGSGLINFTHDVYWVWMILPLLLGGVGFVKVWLWATRKRLGRSSSRVRAPVAPEPHDPGARGLQGALARQFAWPAQTEPGP